VEPEGRLGATSINKTITRLAQILEEAAEYGMVPSNPAKGKRRRLKRTRPAPVWLDRAEQIQALLAAAGELDRAARADRQIARRATLATLVFAGLRIGELMDLRWRDVDLAGNRLQVRASKTDAGIREIDLLPTLRDELVEHKMSCAAIASDDRVFPTTAGRKQYASNIRNRVLAGAVELANRRLEERGEVALPDGLSPHKLRHTFGSILVSLGVDPGAVMDQQGHTDAAFTLRVYRHAMRRTPQAKRQLAELVGAPHWAPLGSTASNEPFQSLSAGFAPVPKTRRAQEETPARPAGFEPATSRSGGERSIH